MSDTLNVHSIESFGTHDGPGIRMVVFLQECNLKCKYCQNPDTISGNKRGTVTTIDELTERAEKMKSYFKNGGGITISGGEPMLQSKALLPFFDRMANMGIHTNIDTNGTIKTAYSTELLKKSDLIMFDIKHTTGLGFKSITGKNGLTNLLKNIQFREDHQKEYWLRYVLVPGYTDSMDSYTRLIDLFSNNRFLTKFEILPYHSLGKHKWEMLNWKYEFEHVKENSEEQLDKAEKILKKHFKNFQIAR